MPLPGESCSFRKALWNRVGSKSMRLNFVCASGSHRRKIHKIENCSKPPARTPAPLSNAEYSRSCVVPGVFGAAAEITRKMQHCCPTHAVAVLMLLENAYRTAHRIVVNNSAT